MSQEVDPLIGHEIAGKYRVLSVIASGGMGRVYKAEQQPIGRVVALKLLHSGRLSAGGTGTSTASASGNDSQVQEKRFLREASILAKLTHPSIVTLFDYGSMDSPDQPGDKRFFMVMEYVSGQTLQERIQQRGALPQDEAVRFLVQVAKGLREAHVLGIIHRDLKPLNLMITADRDGTETIKILDFGIVKLLSEEAAREESAELTQEGLFVGSPMYMAPEQIESGKVDVRSDIYSLGVVLYRCLSGVLPFKPGSSMQIMMAHIRERPTPLLEKAPHVHPWLADLVHRCLDKDPAGRPQSMDELLRELTPNISDSFITAAGRSSAVLRQLHDHPSGRESTGNATVSAGVASLPIAGGEPEKKGRGAIWIGLFVLLLAGGGVAAFALRPAPEKAASTDKSASPPPEPAKANKKSFSLMLDSSPSGADVFEGDKRLGTTPIQLSITHDSVATSARSFTLKKEGYTPYTVAQGPSDESVRFAAPLTAIAPAPSATAVVASTSASVERSAPPIVFRPGGPRPPASTPPKATVDIDTSR